MASKTEIANMALTSLGAANITDIDEDSSNARKVRAVYDNLREAVLEEHPWNFAMERVTKAPSEEVPAFGYVYKILRPTDCLRIVNIYADSSETNELRYKPEGKYILCDSNIVYIKYIKNIKDETLFTALFAQALAARIAYELCFPITNSYNVQGQMMTLYNAKLAIARSIDALEGSPDDIDEEGPGTWVGAHN